MHSIDQMHQWQMVKLVEVEESGTSLQQLEEKKEQENRETGDHIKVM